VNATLRHVKYVATENPVTLGAFLLFTGFVLLALFGPWIAPYDPLASSTEAALKPPSIAHWFGTDSLGRDILSRIVVAAIDDLWSSRAFHAGELVRADMIEANHGSSSGSKARSRRSRRRGGMAGVGP